MIREARTWLKLKVWMANSHAGRLAGASKSCRRSAPCRPPTRWQVCGCAGGHGQPATWAVPSVTPPATTSGPDFADISITPTESFFRRLTRHPAVNWNRSGMACLWRHSNRAQEILPRWLNGPSAHGARRLPNKLPPIPALSEKVLILRNISVVLTLPAFLGIESLNA
jgi:hypothetical protein